MKRRFNSWKKWQRISSWIGKHCIVTKVDIADECRRRRRRRRRRRTKKLVIETAIGLFIYSLSSLFLSSSTLFSN
jgi:hypothetical protein